jgi:hypothetical protein
LLWPSAIALGFLVFLGAIGQGSAVKTASADTGDVCLILSTAEVSSDGTFIFTEGETELVVAIIEANAFDEDLEVFDAEVDLDDSTGDSNLTSRAEEDDDFWEYVDGYETDIFAEVGIIHPGDDFDDLVDDLDDLFNDGDPFIEVLQDVDGEFPEAEIGDNVCGDDDETILEDLSDFLFDVIVECLDQNQCEDFDWTFDPDNDQAVQEAGFTLAEVAEGWAEILIDDPDLLDESCFDAFHDEAELFLIGGGTTEEEAADAVNQFCDFIGSDFDNFDDVDLGDADLGLDGWIIVDVTCEDAGEFEVSFSIFGENEDSKGENFVCVGEVDEGVITATPNKVEVVPALGSISYSLIVVNLLDADGNPADEGNTVTFTTDICEFLDEDGIDDQAVLEEALEVFNDYDVNHPETAEDVNDFVEAHIEDDPDDVSNDVPAITLSDDFGDFDEGDTVAAIVLDCSDEDIKPGVTEVCFDIDIEDQDVEGCVKVTVVGPPAKITAAAAPASLICGEKATITFEVLDSANQPVSDHTRVEAVTNIGGVLAGTGAVAGQAGLVSPVSSTVAETFGGKGTIYLLTSDAHTGPYEVVLASGGQGSVNTALGGVFSTPPVVVQVTVACTQPAAAPAAPAPTVTAPRTGTGTISPPNTGEAGLADTTSGFSWALVAVAGVVAFSVAGLATLKISRR